MTAADEKLSGKSIGAHPLGSHMGYNPAFYKKAMFERRVAARKARLKEKIEDNKPTPVVDRETAPVIPPHIDGRPSLALIKYRVAWVCGISLEEIDSVRRNENIVKARHMYAYLAKKYTSNSYPQIGRTLGGRDHSTIIHAAREWPNRKKKMRAKRR